MGRFIATVPSYYKDFICKCGACRHTCCDGWGITVSEAEYFRLLGEDCPDDLRHRLDNALTVLDFPTEERYGYLRPNYLGNCKLLREDGLCALHAGCGEDALPLICRLYPRAVKRYGDRHEIVISNSCERVLEMLMDSSDTLTFSDVAVDLPFDGLPVYDADPAKDALRYRAIGIMSDRSMPIPARLSKIGRDICGEAAVPADDKITAIHEMRRCVEQLEAHSDSVRTAADKAFSYLGDTSDEEAYDLFVSAEQKLYAVLPDIEAYAERIIVNHMAYESFPYASGCTSLSGAFAALVSSVALLKFLSVCGAAVSACREELIDLLAGVYRFVEHTDYYALSSKRAHICGSAVFARFAKLLDAPHAR